MPDEVTFMDLACLMRIAQDTTIEKLGSAINASIFDASNIAGTLKQKNLIDFTSYYPGPNTIAITEVGKALIAEADAKAAEQFDHLDGEILMHLSGGKRSAMELQNSLNLRPKDLALRLYKLSKQGFITYELKSGTVDIMLTESGFLKSKASMAPAMPAAQTSAPMSAPMAGQQMPPMAQKQDMQQPMPQPTSQTTGAPMMPSAQKKPPIVLILAIIILLAIIAGGLYYLNYI